jgi:hypothetical protein
VHDQSITSNRFEGATRARLIIIITAREAHDDRIAQLLVTAEFRPWPGQAIRLVGVEQAVVSPAATLE